MQEGRGYRGRLGVWMKGWGYGGREGVQPRRRPVWQGRGNYSFALVSNWAILPRYIVQVLT